MNYKNYSGNAFDRISNAESNLFQTTTYNTELNGNWILKTGLAFGLTDDKQKINSNKLIDNLKFCHAKFGLVNNTGKFVTIKFGAETFFTGNQKKYIRNDIPEHYAQRFNDYLPAGYVETDIMPLKNIAVRAGLRSEYSTYTDNINLAPRLSLAFKIAEANQFSFAWGKFYQHVRNDFLLISDSLKFENAVHFIVNYQYSANNRLFRIEAYHKKYGNLIRYRFNNSTGYSGLSNSGRGYANGVDIFWRDRKTFKNADYWISYSYIDTRRLYKDYPVSAIPDYVSKHNLSVVYKQWIPKIETQLSFSYKYRSGRPYYNPNNEDFMSDKTKSFNDISLALSHLTNVFGNFTIIYISCNNLFGFNNVFGYHYDAEPDNSGVYESHAIQSYAKRTFIIGIFISIK